MVCHIIFIILYSSELWENHDLYKTKKNSDSQFIQNRAALYDNLKMLVMSYLQINKKKVLKNYAINGLSINLHLLRHPLPSNSLSRGYS